MRPTLLRAAPSSLALLVLLIIPFNFADQNFGGDAKSYFSHATTILFNGDLSYENDIRVTPPHPYGASLWFAGVAYPFSRIDVAQRHPIVENRAEMVGSWTFYGFIWASPAAFMLGFVLIHSAMRRLGLHPSRVLLWLLLVGGGVGGIWAHFSFLHSHAVEFLSISIVLSLSVLLARANPTVAQRAAFYLPIAIAFGLSVRPQNIGLILMPFVVHALSDVLSPQATRSGISARRLSALLGGSAVAGPALLLGNLRFYTQPYPTITGTYGADLFSSAPTVLRRDMAEQSALVGETVAIIDRGFGIAFWYGERILEVPNFLFTLATTAEFGLLWWTPALVIGPLSAAFVLLRGGPSVEMKWGRRSIVLAAVIAVYSVPLAVVFRWQSFGSGWGFRYLLSTLPISIVFVFALLDRIGPRKRSALRAFLVATALFSVLSQVFFYTTAEFRHVPDALKLNSFGRMTDKSFPGLARDVLRASASPEVWMAAFSGRSTGFLGLQLVGEERAVRMLEVAGLSNSFRYSVDEALAVVGALPDRVRWAYNVTLLAFPLLHYWLMRPPRLAERVRGRFRSFRAVRLQSSQGDGSTALP